MCAHSLNGVNSTQRRRILIANKGMFKEAIKINSSSKKQFEIEPQDDLSRDSANTLLSPRKKIRESSP